MNATKPYEFPNGYNNLFPQYRIPEMLFAPKRSILADTSFMSVSDMVNASISQCDADIRPHLQSNIYITGGNTSFPGFAERLQNDLAGPQNAVCGWFRLSVGG